VSALRVETMKTIVVTGASDGIGAAAARKLHADGHRVIVVGRSPEKTAAIGKELGADHFVADFAVLDQVRELAAGLDAACPSIDVFCNNAGGVFGDPAKTVDGFEKTFQVNHLAPFLLTQLLLDKLIAAGASVIQTSSFAARMTGKIEMDDLEHDRDFNANVAYGTVKLENILFTKELHRRYHDRGISSAAFHPGVVATGFAAESHSWLRHMYTNPIGRLFMTSPEKGADQMVWLAEGRPGEDWESGTYYEKRKPASRNNPQALDDGLGEWLWERSEELLSTGSV
jgi:NAD(P)-dependent dehydrogenase (short-subunit alcohol dehydrogenase family)